MRIPELDLSRFDGVPAPVATAAELRRAGRLGVQAWGEQLVLTWNGGRPSAFVDACPHLGLPLSMGRITADGLACRYHGWTFDPQSGEVVAQPTLRKPRPCSLRRWGCMLLGGLVFAWRGDASPEQARGALPETIYSDFSLHRVEMASPFYLALFNAIDYAHFARHRFYAPTYALYRRLRRDGHVPGQPFHWEERPGDEQRIRMRLVEARRDLVLTPTCAEFQDEGGVNHFQTFVTPLGPRRTLYWECYRARSDNPAVRLAARALFRTVIVHLLDTEDRDWTGLSTPGFLGSDNIHLSATDAPLGAHLRRFVLPRMVSQDVATE